MLAIMAESLAGRGHFERAAYAAGAAAARCETVGLRMPEYERTSFNLAMASIRTALGEPRFAAALAEVRAMTREQL